MTGVDPPGEEKDSILLTCGWWGIVRHFNYVPELAAAFLWTLPCLFENVRLSSLRLSS